MAFAFEILDSSILFELLRDLEFLSHRGNDLTMSSIVKFSADVVLDQNIYFGVGVDR
jgi:hypothetical protein